MNILGIETSCDETSASVVRDGRVILSLSTASSLADHSRFGGVIPEIASRRQLEFIDAVVKTALSTARVKLSQIDAVAVTKAPGLIGSLLVGLSFSRSLCFAAQKPLVEIDHIKAHLYASFLSDTRSGIQERPHLPAVGLIVSGGHSSLYEIRGFTDFRLLGQTRDDAAGEAFDKVARILGLGYPGGPAIDQAARNVQQARPVFKCAALPGSLDFSFSGVKTAVLYHHQKSQRRTGYDIRQTAADFQQSVVENLVEKSVAACRKTGHQTLILGGGVAANSCLRARLAERTRDNGIRLFIPPLRLCTDNAAMIAGMGCHYFHQN